MPKEVFGWNRPVFKQPLGQDSFREVFIAPETCPAKHLSVWIFCTSRQKEEPKEKVFDMHEGIEEAFYIVKGRMRLCTPNESTILEQGGFGWVPAGMPHRGEPLEDEVTVLVIYGPARSGKKGRSRLTLEEGKKIAKEITG